MKLLLDTHIWIWGFLEPERIGSRLARTLENEKHELWLSPLSIWEVGLLADDGRLPVGGSVEEWIVRALNELPVIDAQLGHEVAREARAVRLPHRDPVDRLLAATARVYDLTLVTADERILAGTGFRTMRNR